MKNVDDPQNLHFTRYRPGQTEGHYESFFLRANHPSRPFAFWIRYTIFSPKDRPEKAIGELWAVYFDGEQANHTAAKKEVPIDQCRFSNHALEVYIGGAVLNENSLKGGIDSTISWELDYSGERDPVYDFPAGFYHGAFPKAKALVSLPLGVFNGNIRIKDKKISINNWTGSQNHNWGSRHTDLYAWGQVAGFDNSPGSFLEIATARLKIGPFWTPFMTPIVLRHDGIQYSLNRLHTLFGRASFTYFNWHFTADSRDVYMDGIISADKKDFVCLPYYNPPGGIKYCLNTKIASCTLNLNLKKTGKSILLSTRDRAAFEILTDDVKHGLSPAI